MRISSNESDPGFAAWNADRERWQGVKILLDGIEVKQVETFDTDIGFVRKARFNEQGQIFCEPGTDTIAMEDLYGVITLRERA